MAVLQQRWKNLAVSVADAILTISMNRPKVNAMSADLLNDLEQAFDYASKDVAIKGVHLRSNFRYRMKSERQNFFQINLRSILSVRHFVPA